MTSTYTFDDGVSVRRLGFGAMRLTEWDHVPAGAATVARRAAELGVTFFDTADAYDLGLNEELLADALHPYAGLFIATKCGHARPSRGEWVPLGRPEYLRQQAELSLRRLRVERLDLLQLHRLDPQVSLADQIGALARLRDEGKVARIGLSEVSVAQLAEARSIAPIESVQNRYNLTDRASDDVLDYCEREGIAFVPWLPIARGDHAAAGGVLGKVAAGLGATPAQVSLAWLLRRSPVVIPIPGTSSVAHLEENCGVADITLSDDDFARLSEQA
ncbi:Putative oxidoreductase [Amycolatopsis camponoti]|uniref:Oxidoreductase n=1 Tax=Amycolatopsis camponoti TaxID=2606593 RepID=A0A6I8LEH6_9PSEU|nr:aldo/keto reductase [Amycolatopsis camponoti]VVJ15764.1 Putative oxidoreductase [Amycolatopsis camponoti]